MVEVSPQFRARLRRITAKAEAAARVAMEKSADEMVETMKRIAPERTGELRESIRWKWVGPGEDPGALTVGKVRSGPNAGKEFAEMRLVIFAGNRETGEAFYARWVEFGTSKSKAKAFFFPTYRGLRPTAKRRISRAIRKALTDG
jgi:HK97 gp10 family phage protein